MTRPQITAGSVPPSWLHCLDSDTPAQALPEHGITLLQLGASAGRRDGHWRRP